MLINCVEVKDGNRPRAGRVDMMEVKELEKALKFEQAKVSVLVNEVIGLEDEIVNRMLGDFGNVVNAESREYWRGQLLENRTEAAKALASMAGLVGGGSPVGSGRVAGGRSGAHEVGTRERVKEAMGPGGSGRKPLHNRALARPVPRTVTGDAAQGAADAKRAGMVRNRAQEIARNERIPFSMAFRRAEREIGGQ